jgi:hypothetical protein
VSLLRAAVVPTACGNSDSKGTSGKRFLAFFVLILGSIFLANCGGGGSGSSSSTSSPPPPPSFSIAAKPSSLTISPNTSAQIKLSLTPVNGFSGSVNVALSGLPAGVTVSPASPVTLTTAGLTLTLTADSSVTNGNYTLTFDGTSGSLSASSSTTLTVEPLASFSLTLTFSNLIVRQGGSVSGLFDITVGTGSANFTLDPSVQGLPSGVTATFVPAQPGIGQSTMTLTATSAATLAQNAPAELVLKRASDGATASANFTVTVAQPAGSLPGNRTNFADTDDTPKSIVYDSVHKLVYAALPDLSRVDAIDPTTSQVVREIPVPDAQGLSLTPDGTRILVSGFPQQVAWIDTASQKIVRRDILPTDQSYCATCPPEFVSAGTPFVMASGKVIFLATARLGSTVMEWDPSVPDQIHQISIPGGLGVRSADGTKALFSAGTIGLFDSATDGLTATRTFAGSPSVLAANPNGTQFAVVVGTVGAFFLDDQLNTLATLPVGGAVTGMVYSPDGKYLYVVSQNGAFPLIWKVDATTFQLVGTAPAYASNVAYIPRLPPLVVETPMAADSTGMLFGAADHGVALDDSTDLQTLSLSAINPTNAIIASPAEGKQNSSTPVTITTQTFNNIPDVWFGGLRGTNLSLSPIDQAQATAPPSPATGPMNVKIISPDGTEGNIPEAYTYGASAVNFAPIAASPSGGVTADIFGFGYGSDLGSSSTQVQIGGASANVSESNLFPTEYPFPYPFPLDHVRLTLPPGSPGAADIQVTSPSGTTTIAKGLHYLQSVTDYPSTDSFQFVLYDPKRQQIYLSAGDHIDVFSLAGHTFLTPITPPSLGGQRQMGRLALTPDDSRLLAVNVADNSVAVINPDDPSTAQAVAVKNGLGTVSTIATTSTGLAFVMGSGIYQIDLSTLQATMVSGLTGFLAGARNGSTILLYTPGDTGGQVYSWTTTSGTWTIEHPTQVTIFDGAVSGDGSVMATDILAEDVQGGHTYTDTIVNFFDPFTNLLGSTGLSQYMQAAPAINGMELNDAGSLAYVPVLVDVPTVTTSTAFSQNAVDIYDVRNNVLRERVLLSEQFPATSLGGMDIDPAGKNIFLITKAGLTVVTLDSVPLSIGSVTPSSGTAGASVTIHGSGFVQGTTATFNGTAGSVTFVDADTLQATIPSSLASGAVSIMLTNPDGTSYKLDDAFTAN